MKKPLVNIIIVTYQEYGFTKKCLESLLSASYKNIAIYLVDNHSEIGKYEQFYRKFKETKKVKIFRTEKNLGFGGGCNRALEMIKEGYVVFLNNDTVVDKNWLTPIVSYMEKNPRVGACQPKIMSLQKKTLFEYAGAAGGMMDIYGYPFCRGRIFFTREKDTGQYDNIVDLVWCSGTAMITKKSIINKVGNFDEIFFMYGEEADLCWRINHAGYKLKLVPSSRVYHQGAATMKKNPGYKKTYLTHRNGLILLLKNYTVSEWFKYVSVRIVLDFVTFAYYLLNHPSTLNWLALLKAYLNCFFIFPKILQRHFQIRKLRLNSKMIYPPLYTRSIVWDYFVKRKKIFSQLPKDAFMLV